MREALGALELATARRFLERNRPIMPQEGSGNGADALLTTMVSMPPLRLAILAIGGGPLVDALLDVARRTPTTVLPTLAIDESVLAVPLRLQRLSPFLRFRSRPRSARSRAAGAAIDVFDPEPPGADYPLLGLDNVLLTPHMAARTHTAVENMSWVVRDVVAVLSGRAPRHPAP